MEYINEINSYNSLSMSPNCKKENRVSTSYSTTKINIQNELNDTIKKSEINPFKRVSIDLHSTHPQILNVNTDKNLTNIQDISTKEEDSSSNTLTKLPKIQRHVTSTSLSALKDNRNNFNKTITNGSTTNMTNQKDNSSINNNNSSINSHTTFKLFTNNNKDVVYSSHNNNKFNNSHAISFKNFNPLIPPADPLLKRTVVPKVNPRFGKMKAYITLPDFRGEEPITKFEYKPILKEMLTNPTIEKQYEVSLYVNSTKMINNLIYLKTQLNKEGLITLENFVNVKKLNKAYKNETEEEEELIQLCPDSGGYVNNLSNNCLDNSCFNNNENNNGNNAGENNDNNNNNGANVDNQTINVDSKNNENIDNGATKNNQQNNSNHNNKNMTRPKTVYHELKPYYTLKNKNDKTLIFESRFESGNLLCAFRTEDENSYQLYLQNDTNTTGYIQWFFFRVSNTKKGRKVNFNIINMLRKTCIYNHGLKIMTYSTMTAAKENIGWHRDCDNMIYYSNNLYVYNANNDKKRNLHSLSFDYEFKYDNDTVYFANCLPYFYSKLMKELNTYELDETKYPFFHRKTLATTLGGNDLDMFTINSMYDIYKNGITNVVTSKSNKNVNKNLNIGSNNNNYNSSYYQNSNNQVQLCKTNKNSSKVVDQRKAAVIIARQHPGETVGSHVMKGCIDFLMGESDEAKKLREIYLFKIVPMMNPDGVLVGNSRTSFAGCDLNRRWGKPNEIIHPEIFHTKQMITKLATQRNIAFVVDCHGHFGTFNSLFYCNYKDNKRTCKLFPYICCKLSKIISFQQCTFSMPKYKLTTERISLFNELDEEDNDNIVALETSFFGINRTGEYARTYFNSNLLKEIGRDICLGMLSFYYKFENVTIEPNLFHNKDKLDVDMREFESEIIREVNEDDEEIDCADEKSESEPSVDNLDKNQIMRLMPTNGKRRRRRGKNKLRKFDKKKDKDKNRDLDIELFNPLKEAAKKLEEEKRKKANKTPSKIVINCNDRNKKNNQLQQPILTDPNMKNEYTQTEEMFFKMHWSYFTGQYKILQCKRNGSSNNNNNFVGMSSNFFGQINKNRNIYNNALMSNRKQDYNSYNSLNANILSNNNSNNRAKSLSNRLMFGNNNGANNGINGGDNSSLKKTLSLKNNIKNNGGNYNNINGDINNSNNINSLVKTNIKMVRSQNNNFINHNNNYMGKSQYSNFISNKHKNIINNNSSKDDNKNIFTKTSTSVLNPFNMKNSKNKSNNQADDKSENENGNVNSTNNNKLYSTKFNFNKKDNLQNLKNKMTKSSTSFYKH